MSVRFFLKPWVPTLLLFIPIIWLSRPSQNADSGGSAAPLRPGQSSAIPVDSAKNRPPNEDLTPERPSAAEKTSTSPLAPASPLSKVTVTPDIDILPRSEPEMLEAFERAVGPMLARSLPDARRDQIFEHFRGRLNAPQEPSHYLCWAESTPPHIVEAAQLAENAANRLIGSAFSTQAFQSIGSGRWSSTATDGGTGSEGTPITLTWSFPPDGTMTDENESSDLIARLAVIYASQGANTTDLPADQPWFSVFTRALDDLSRETGVIFTYEPNDDGASMSQFNNGIVGTRGDLRFFGANIDGNNNTLAYNYSPGYGDMLIDTNDSFFTNTGSDSKRLRNTVSHEVGHGIGLGHVCPVNNTKLMEPFINLGFDGAQFDDVFSIQLRYGDHLERHNGSEGNNDSPTNATPLTLVTDTPLTIPERLSLDDSVDVDFFEFTATAGQLLSTTVTPSDESYLEGSQNSDGTCSSGTSIDFSIFQDLSLAILDSDKTTVLASNDSGDLGEEETLNYSFPSSGTFYLRVDGDSNDATQIYSLSLNLASPLTTLTLESTDLTTSESDGADTATIVVHSAVEVPSEITVSLIPSGTADSADWSGTLSATIPAGSQNSNPIVISAVSDADFEGAEILSLGITPYTSGDVPYDLGVPSSLDIQIEDQPTPLVSLTNTSIIEESFSEQNGAPDPGETIVVEIGLENIGSANATLTSAELSGPSGFIPFLSIQDYGDIPIGASAARNFTFALNGICGEVLDLTLSVTTDEGTSANYPLPLRLGLGGIPIVEDVEEGGALPPQWTSSKTGSGSGWSASTARSSSGSYSFFATNPGSTGTSYLDSPTFELPDPAGSMSFTHYYNTEFEWDGGALEISIGGGTWQDIEDAGGVFTSNGYNVTLESSQNVLKNRRAWSGDSGGFITTQLDFPTSAAGQMVQLRWIMGSDGFLSDEGWYLDDITTPTASSCDTSGPALVLSQNGTELSEQDPSQFVDVTVSTTPLLPTATEIPITFINSGTGDELTDVTGLTALSIPVGESAATSTLFAVNDSEAEGSESLELTIPEVTTSITIQIADTSYGTWAAAELGTTGNILPNEDFDGDGALNIEEFAFNTDGTDPAILPPPATPTALTLVIPAPPAPLPPGLSVMAEVSTDLDSWTTDGVSITAEGFEISLEGAQKFVRLAYTLTP